MAASLCSTGRSNTEKEKENKLLSASAISFHYLLAQQTGAAITGGIITTSLEVELDLWDLPCCLLIHTEILQSKLIKTSSSNPGEEEWNKITTSSIWIHYLGYEQLLCKTWHFSVFCLLDTSTFRGYIHFSWQWTIKKLTSTFAANVQPGMCVPFNFKSHTKAYIKYPIWYIATTQWLAVRIHIWKNTLLIKKTNKKITYPLDDRIWREKTTISDLSETKVSVFCK